ncbi:hypothetical protein [Brachybacterium sp. FME24]|uniref:hypothetical protein n=1 Tax=Brachybacterium sp. FME24 TaxID=2742605 RepID=UPI001868C801|nr:hypothetical protein [Brachybacterium sp. FME24]
MVSMHAAREWLAAHDARVKRDAARDALDGLAAESRALARDMEPHDQGSNAYTARAARLYRDTHHPEDVNQ